MPGMPNLRRSFTGLWRDREFLKFWAASAISDVGTQVSTLALPLIAAITLGATAWQMGLLSAAGSVPVLFVGLFAGVWVDRLRRRPVMIVADVARAALLLVIPLASFYGALTIEILYVVTALAGTFAVLFDVAFLSFVPSLVREQDLMDANAKLELTSSTAQVAGPGIGGVLVNALGAPFAVLIDALSFLGSAFFLLRTRVPEPRAPSSSERGGVLAEVGEGLTVVIRHPILQALARTSATMSFFSGMFLAVYVLYMTRDLALGPVAVGLIFATGGVGSLAGAIVAARVARQLGPGPALLRTMLLFGLTGLCVPLAVLVPRVALPLVVAAEFAQWMMIVIYYVTAVSVRQAIAPDRLRGRVNATMRFLARGAHPVGALTGGALGAAIGVPLTLTVAAFGFLLAFVWLALSPVRDLRNMPSTELATLDIRG
jgi:predicted MFS family arabinose efflux permease